MRKITFEEQTARFWKIDKLRREGKSFKEIDRILGFSPKGNYSLILYYKYINLYNPKNTTKNSTFTLKFNCIYCGKEVTLTNPTGRHAKRKFCSKHCLDRYYKLKQITEEDIIKKEKRKKEIKEKVEIIRKARINGKTWKEINKIIGVKEDSNIASCFWQRHRNSYIKNGKEIDFEKNKIKELRLAKGITSQTELLKIINEKYGIKISRQTYINYENHGLCKEAKGLEFIAKLADFFGVSINYMLNTKNK